MIDHSRCSSVACLAVFIAVQSASAFVIYDEAVQGDLPNVAAGAPELVLSEGINEIVGVVGGAADPADEFKFVLPPELQIDEVLIHAGFAPINDPAEEFFFSNLVGPLIVDNVTVFTSADFGRTLGQDINVGTDYAWGGGTLPILKGPNDPPSLADPPFPMRDVTAPVPVRLSIDIDPTYTLSFIVTPEPATAVMLSLGSLSLLNRRRQ